MDDPDDLDDAIDTATNRVRDAQGSFSKALDVGADAPRALGNEVRLRAEDVAQLTEEAAAESRDMAVSIAREKIDRGERPSFSLRVDGSPRVVTIDQMPWVTGIAAGKESEIDVGRRIVAEELGANPDSIDIDLAD